MENGVVNCCNSSSLSRGNICFEYINGSSVNSQQLSSHCCLPARTIIEHANQYCNLILPCTDTNTYCMKPAVDNRTKVSIVYFFETKYLAKIMEIIDILLFLYRL